jgi:hypothetical protein
VPIRLSVRAGGARTELLAALEREGLAGFRSSSELAWVVFPAPPEGTTSLEVLYVPHLDRYRVVARDAGRGSVDRSVDPARLLGEVETAGEAAGCVAEALLPAPV